jgi:hypothetical protein
MGPGDEYSALRISALRQHADGASEAVAGRAAGAMAGAMPVPVGQREQPLQALGYARGLDGHLSPDASPRPVPVPRPDAELVFR